MDIHAFTISTDRSLLDVELIQNFLVNGSYWAKNRTLEQTRKAIENSLCFGVYAAGLQVGFGRVVSDYATFAYIGDVFVLDQYRKRGVGKILMQAMIDHPDLQGLRRWVLATRDAHGLYEQYGFSGLAHPERWMERPAPDAY